MPSVEIDDLRKVVRREPEAVVALRVAGKDHDTASGDAAQFG